MIIKNIQIEEVPFSKAEVKVLFESGDVRCELFNVDEEGNEVGERWLSVGFSPPLPFTLTALQIEKLRPTPVEVKPLI